MDFELKKISAGSIKTLYDSSVEVTPETEIILPDFCSDIRKILKCSCEPGIKSVQQSGERITAEGECRINLIYVNDKGKTECYGSTVDFTRFIEVPDAAENCFISAFAKTEYLNCRATGQRKVSVSGRISVRFTVTVPEENKIVCAAEGCGIQTKNEKFAFCRLSAYTKKCFDMNETISIEDREPSIGGILHFDTVIKKDTVKAINGKMLIKGSVLSKIYYVSDDDNKAIVCREHEMPVSQILEAEGITEEADCSVMLNICYAQIHTQTDSSGSSRLLEFTYKIQAELKCYEKCESSVVTDCFPTLNEINSDFDTYELITGRTEISEVKSNRCSVELLPGTDFEIKGFWCREITDSCVCSMREYENTICAVICILYSDSSGACGYVEKPVDIKISGSLSENVNEARCFSYEQIKELSCVKSGTGKAEISVSVQSTVNIEYIRKMRICTDIRPDEEKRINKKSFLAVRYCESGESLWDIASYYNTSLNSIKEENGIQEDSLNESCVLVIPC